MNREYDADYYLTTVVAGIANRACANAAVGEQQGQQHQVLHRPQPQRFVAYPHLEWPENVNFQCRIAPRGAMLVR